MSSESIFISTSIPFVNGDPHVGFAWELVIADVLARYQRARGRRVTLLTGTDDNSLKNVRAAEARGEPVRDFVRARGERFLALCRALHVSNDDFIQTAFDPRHAPAVERLWRACDARGDLYRSRYTGAYCVGCEQFYAPHELPDGRCPEHESVLEHVDEDNHFFRLSRHGKLIERLLSSEALRVRPDSYRAELEAWLETGLADFSVSRSTRRARGWGIPVPGDPQQTVYVWFDALVNYVSALGYGRDSPEFVERWQAAGRRIHVIGKNVTRFHCIYWPAILASAGLAAPTDVVVHGFLTVAGRKIGKSLGNGVDPFALLERFGADRVRHYLSRQFPLGRDGDVSLAGLVHASNDELADQLGNLQSRLLVLLEQNTASLVPRAPSQPSALAAAAQRCTERCIERLEACDPQLASVSAFELVRACNLELARTEPWRLARQLRLTREPRERAALDSSLLDVLADAARGLLWAAGLLRPFLPEAAASIARAFAVPVPAVYAEPRPAWAEVGASSRVQREAALFARVSAASAESPPASS